MITWRGLAASFLFSLFLVACTVAPDPTLTPVEDVVEVKRPSSTPRPTLTATPQPTATLEPTATDKIPTVTAIPTLTPIPSPTPDLQLSVITQSELNKTLSPMTNEGLLPFIEDDVLFRQMAEGSDKLIELGYVKTAVWSPDGSKLIYNLTDTPDTFDDPATTFTQWLWSVEEGSIVSLSDLIANYPNPAHHVFDIHWSPDETKILLEASLDERHEDEQFRLYTYLVAAVDLNQGVMGDILFYSNSTPVWLTDEVYVIRDGCGSPCAMYRAYDYSGKLVWEFDWRTGGFVDFADMGNFMINVGRGQPDTRRNDPQPPATVDEINLSTGELKILWEGPSRSPEGGYFNAFFAPELSPDEQFVSFNYGYPQTVYVIDRNGEEYWHYANSHVVDWRPNNELTVCEMLDSGGSQLVHLTLDGETQIIFSTEPDTEISHCSWDINGGGQWGPDGRYFIFSTENHTENAHNLYLWLPENDEVRFITSYIGEEGFSNLGSFPDSTGFYFTNEQDETIWKYDVETIE